MVHDAPVRRPCEAVRDCITFALPFSLAIWSDAIERSGFLARRVLIHAADPEAAVGTDLAVVEAIGRRFADRLCQVGDFARARIEQDDVMAKCDDETARAT